MRGREREGSGPAQAIATLGAVIADQPGGWGFSRAGGVEQGAHVVVVGVGFVDEAAAILAHGDEAGFGAFHQVWEAAEAAVFAWDPGHRCPCGGVGQVGCYARADAFAQAQAIAGIAFGRCAQVFGAVGGMGEQAGDALLIVGEAATREDHAAPGVDLGQATGRFDARAGHPRTVAQQFPHGGFSQQAHVAIQRAFEQAANQCVAVHQVHATAMTQQVAGMAQQALAGVEQ